jgi:hypothetical protein
MHLMFLRTSDVLSHLIGSFSSERRGVWDANNL